MPGARQMRRSEYWLRPRTRPTAAPGAPGSGSSLGDLRDDDLVDGEIRHRLVQSRVLRLQCLEPFRLVNLQTAGGLRQR